MPFVGEIFHWIILRTVFTLQKTDRIGFSRQIRFWCFLDPADRLLWRRYTWIRVACIEKILHYVFLKNKKFLPWTLCTLKISLRFEGFWKSEWETDSLNIQWLDKCYDTTVGSLECHSINTVWSIERSVATTTDHAHQSDRMSWLKNGCAKMQKEEAFHLVSRRARSAHATCLWATF